jgi:hypothetical protein
VVRLRTCVPSGVGLTSDYCRPPLMQKVVCKLMRPSPRLLLGILCSSFAWFVTPWLTGQQSQQPSPVIRSVTNEVLVPVVVRDAQGHAVGNLTKDNFEVFDNGKAQAITSFTIINRAVENAEVKSPASSPDGSAAVSPPLPPAQRFIAMLFDVYNLSDTDLAQAREAAITVIDSSLAPTDMAAVVSNQSVFAAIQLLRVGACGPRW